MAAMQDQILQRRLRAEDQQVRVALMIGDGSSSDSLPDRYSFPATAIKGLAVSLLERR